MKVVLSSEPIMDQQRSLTTAGMAARLMSYRYLLDGKKTGKEAIKRYVGSGVFEVVERKKLPKF